MIESMLSSMSTRDARPVDLAAELDRSVALESVRLRASQTVHSGPIVILVVSVVGALFAGLGAGWYAIGWACLVDMAAGINWFMCTSIRKISPMAPRAEVVRQQNRLLWLTVANTTAVGSGIWWIGLHDVTQQSLYAITMLQTLYSIGAFVNASTHPRTFITGTWINLGSMIVYWILQQSPGFIVAASLSGLALLVTRFCFQIHDEFRQSVKIRFENADLLEQVREQVRVADAARAAAEEANLAKSRFLAAASHDLRQPLHSLMLFTSLLDNGSPSDRDEFMRHIHAAAGSLDKLFSSLLDLSKLDSGAVTSNVAAVDLAPIIEAIGEEYAVVAQEKRLVLAICCEDVVAATDAFLIERVLRNLVDNAVKYTEDGSVTVHARRRDDKIVVEVTDTGIGIPANELTSIFDEFHRVRRSGGSTASGSGLGLAIVARLCELLGHAISVESSVDHGSRFTLTLAAAPRESSPSTGADAVDGDMERAMRLAPFTPVIVVDDDPAICRAMSALVESLDGKVFTFSSCTALCEALDAELVPNPAALITDFRLPGERNGKDVVDQMRLRFPGLPAAIISGDINASPTGIDQMERVAVFRKPVGDREISLWLVRVVAPEWLPDSHPGRP